MRPTPALRFPPSITARAASRDAWRNAVRRTAAPILHDHAELLHQKGVTL